MTSPFPKDIVEVDVSHLVPPAPDGFFIGQPYPAARDLVRYERAIINQLKLKIDDDGLPAFYTSRADAMAVMAELRLHVPNCPKLHLIEIKQSTR